MVVVAPWLPQGTLVVKTAQLASSRPVPQARKCVLIADDDPLLREAMAGLFDKLGFDTITVENGEAAVRHIGKSTLALVVVDLSMPKLDGFELLKHLRQHPRTVDVPVIISTSHDDKGSIEQAYKLGASSFVTKPVNWAQFGYHAQFVIRNGETERDLRAAEAAAVAASKMKNGLFRVLSHELKTPLVSLIGLTDVLSSALKDKVEAIEAEHLDHIVDASQRLNSMVSDVLVLSKSFSGARNLSLSRVLVEELLEDSVAELLFKASEKKININITRPSKGLEIVADADLLRQAIRKLVDNAVQYSPAGGTVEIWAHRKPDRSLVISVRDNGAGIAAARLTECLQPFVQDDMSYGRKSEGLGLGIPIAKSVAEAHGGGLVIQNMPARGTTPGGLVAAIWIADLADHSRTAEAPN